MEGVLKVQAHARRVKVQPKPPDARRAPVLVPEVPEGRREGEEGREEVSEEKQERQERIEKLWRLRGTVAVFFAAFPDDQIEDAVAKAEDFDKLFSEFMDGLQRQCDATSPHAPDSPEFKANEARRQMIARVARQTMAEEDAEEIKLIYEPDPALVALKRLMQMESPRHMPGGGLPMMGEHRGAHGKIQIPWKYFIPTEEEFLKIEAALRPVMHDLHVNYGSQVLIRIEAIK